MDRNLTDFHAEAIAARWLWGREYAQQNGGQLDFYESLSLTRRELCREMVDEIKACQRRAAHDRAAGGED